jgi:hypothetical protein
VYISSLNHSAHSNKFLFCVCRKRIKTIMPFAAVATATPNNHHAGDASATRPRARSSLIIGFIIGVLALTSVPYLKNNVVGINSMRSTFSRGLSTGAAVESFKDETEWDASPVFIDELHSPKESSMKASTSVGSPLIPKSLEDMCEEGPRTEIFTNHFERGLGNFRDPGSDARLYSGRKYSHSGSKSLELRDNSRTSFSVTTPFTVSGLSSLKVEFWYMSKGFNQKNNGFVLQSDADGRGDWITKRRWRYKSNGYHGWRFATVEFPIDTTRMRIRFKNDGDNNHQKIFIDDVVVSGI